MNHLDAVIEQVRQGDVEAFRNVILAYNARVTAYVAGTIANPADVDEIVQDVFIAAFRKIKTYEGEADFGSWLIGIARHKVLMHLRGKQRRQNAFERLRERLITVTDDAAMHLRRRAFREQLEGLRLCVNKLPEESRELVRECYLEGISIARAAQRRERTADAVRARLFRARKQLRDCMERVHA